MGGGAGDVRVLLVVSQPVLAEALAVRMADAPRLTVVGAIGDWASAARALALEPADVVVVDVALLPGGQPAAALERVDPSTHVILVVGDDGPELARTALLSGAAGLVGTSSATTELIDAVYTVTRGGVWLQASRLREVLAAAPVVEEPPAEDVLAALTPRELEVLALMAAGRTRKEIATELFLSVNTVRTHTQNLLAKLDVHSSLEAVVLAMRAGVPPVGSGSP